MVSVAQWLDDSNADSLSCQQLHRLELELTSQVAKRRITSRDADPIFTKIDEIQAAQGGCGSLFNFQR